MSRYDFKRINDPVHGTIGLSDTEIRIINTGAFLRLRTWLRIQVAARRFKLAEFSEALAASSGLTGYRSCFREERK